MCTRFPAPWVRRAIPGLCGLLACLLCCAAVWAQASGRQTVVGGGDTYGYLFLPPQDPACAHQFIDLRASGNPVTFTASGGDPAADDGGAVIPLARSFELFGQTLPAVVMSSNGYLAAASSLANEDGGDFSNDRLPAVPGNTAGTVARLMAFHDDLDGGPTAGSAQTQTFAICPRPSGALADEPCTILQWSAWGTVAGDGPFDLQLLLYHRSFAIAFQTGTGDPLPIGGTVGLQDGAAKNALEYLGSLGGGEAVCIFDPRFPPGGPIADLAVVELTDRSEEAFPGGTVAYTLGIRNRGPSPAPGATVTDLFEPPFERCTWTCESAPGASCTASGAGDLRDTVDLPPAGWVSYSILCSVDPLATGTLVHRASVQPAAGIVDPEAANDMATDVNHLLDVGPIFVDDFETGDPSRWSGASGAVDG